MSLLWAFLKIRPAKHQPWGLFTASQKYGLGLQARAQVRFTDNFGVNWHWFYPIQMLGCEFFKRSVSNQISKASKGFTDLKSISLALVLAFVALGQRRHQTTRLEWQSGTGSVPVLGGRHQDVQRRHQGLHRQLVRRVAGDELLREGRLSKKFSTEVWDLTGPERPWFNGLSVSLWYFSNIEVVVYT